MALASRMSGSFGMALACALTGCAGGRTVVVRVESGAGDGAAPVESAFVQGVSIGASLVPLPVNPRNVIEALSTPELNTVTDQKGEARIQLDGEHAWELVVSVPPTYR